MADALPVAGGEVERPGRHGSDPLEDSRYLAEQLSRSQGEVQALKARLATEEEERKRVELLKDHWKVRCLSNTEPRIISPVITSTDKWHEVTWLLVHEPIRQSVEQLEAVFGNEVVFDPVAQPWKLTYFFQWLTDTFFVYMDRHYANMDQRYIPWLAQRVEVPGRERYCETHRCILGSLEKLKHMSTDYNLYNSATVEQRAAFIRRWTAKLRQDVMLVCAQLKQSMDEEETALPPLVAAHYSEQEETKQIELMAWTGTGEAHIELSMIVAGLEAWATPEARESILAKRLSPVGRWTLETYWLPTYKGRNLFLLQSLMLEAEAQPTAPLPLVNAYWLTVAVPAFLICSIQ